MRLILAYPKALVCAVLLSGSACSPAPLLAPSAVSKEPASSLMAAKGNGRLLTVRATVGTAAKYRLAGVHRYTQADVVHVMVQLFTLYNDTELPVLDQAGNQVQADIPVENLDDPITFANLQNDTVYRVRSIAYKAVGTAASDVISDPAHSYLDIPVAEQDALDAGTLTVKLLDIVFGTSGEVGSIDIANGRVIGACPVPTPVASAPSFASGVSGVQTLAGNVAYGNSNGAGALASFNSPSGVSVQYGGDIVIADTLNHTIRVVDSNGYTSTLSGTAGVSGLLDGPKEQALFNSPEAVAADSNGNVFVADTLNYRIRKIDTSGSVSTLAGGATGTQNIIDGSGGFARFTHPSALTIDNDGVIYIGDGQWLRKLSPEGDVITLAGTGTQAYGQDETFSQIKSLTLDTHHNLYIIDGNLVKEITSFGEARSVAGSSNAGYADGGGADALFNNPNGIAVDGADNLFISDSGNNRIRKIDPSGNVTTLVGGVAGFLDGDAGSARFEGLAGLCISETGLVVTQTNAVRIVTF